MTENLSVFLRDFGVQCSANGHQFLGLLDTPDQTMNMSGVNVVSTMYACTVMTSDATSAGLTSGLSIVVGGVSYVIRDVLLQDDGAFSTLTLSK